MPAKGSIFENRLLNLIFNASPIANIADNAASSPATALYVSLHTASPVSGSQSTSEATYTGYARIAVNRDNTGWVVTGNSVSPASTIIFPTATGGGEIETYFGIGIAPSGAGLLLYFGPISPNISVTSGVTPQLLSGSTITES